MERRMYTQEEREHALRRCDEIGVKKASGETGVPAYTLYAWRRKTKEPEPLPDQPDSGESLVPRAVESPIAEETASEMPTCHESSDFIKAPSPLLKTPIDDPADELELERTPPLYEETGELLRLRIENRALREKNEQLKKALRVFAE